MIAMLWIAHAGHWITAIAYFIPVVAFLAWLVVTQIRERRRDLKASAGRGEAPPPPRR
jgi:hypothetical protein